MHSVSQRHRSKHDSYPQRKLLTSLKERHALTVVCLMINRDNGDRVHSAMIGKLAE